MRPWVPQEFFQRGEKYFQRGEIEIPIMGTCEGSENINRTAKSVNIVICFKLFKVISIVS